MYDFAGNNCFFNDVFAERNGNLAACGQAANEGGRTGFWLVETAPNGDRIWQNVFFPLQDDRWTCFGYSVIQCNDGGWVLGGKQIIPGNASDSQFAVTKIAANHEQLWWREYRDGNDACSAVIETKNENILAVGRTFSPLRGYAVMINQEDGAVIWENVYDEYGPLTALKETDDGYILTATRWIVKIDEDGEVIWDEHQETGNIYNIVSTAGGFILSGHNDEELIPWLARINNEGLIQWQRSYEVEGFEHRMTVGYGLARVPTGGYISVGDHVIAWILRVDDAGNESWQRNDQFGERNERSDNMYNSVVIATDSSPVAVGKAVIDRFSHGLIVKIVPDVSAPVIIDFQPEILEFDILPGDTVFFEVNAVDAQDDSLRYSWILNDEEVSTDTRYTHVFEELSSNSMRCVVSDEGLSDSVSWIINVKEFYICGFSPESTDLEIRRNSTVDFTHHLRSIEGLEFEYRWEHFGRGGNFEFEGEDSIRYNFDLTGEHIIRAGVINNDEIEAVAWDVNVHSIIWWWWPHELELSIPVDTAMVFEVFPFNEESDSLEYSWFINSEIIDSNSSLLEISFPEIGEYEIAASVEEGLESDTVRWSIDVLERSFTTDLTDLADLSASPVLYPASPNPFNSSVKLSVYLPREDHVMLSIFDVNGREATRLVDCNITAGSQTFIWNAGHFPTGIYVARMVAGEKSEMQKVVLVK